MSEQQVFDVINVLENWWGSANFEVKAQIVIAIRDITLASLRSGIHLAEIDNPSIREIEDELERQDMADNGLIPSE